MYFYCILAGAGAAGMVEQLLRLKADCKAADVAGCTPLHVAASGGHSAIAARLLAVGAAPSASDPAGRTPLHWAAKNGHAATVGVLADALQSANGDWHLQVGQARIYSMMSGVQTAFDALSRMTNNCAYLCITPALPKHLRIYARYDHEHAVEQVDQIIR